MQSRDPTDTRPRVRVRPRCVGRYDSIYGCWQSPKAARWLSAARVAVAAAAVRLRRCPRLPPQHAAAVSAAAPGCRRHHRCLCLSLRVLFAAPVLGCRQGSPLSPHRTTVVCHAARCCSCQRLPWTQRLVICRTTLSRVRPPRRLVEVAAHPRNHTALRRRCCVVLASSRCGWHPGCVASPSMHEWRPTSWLATAVPVMLLCPRTCSLPLFFIPCAAASAAMKDGSRICVGRARHV